jgi:hypothetical protein
MDNSSNNAPDKTNWRFDPNTGERISDNQPPPQPAQPAPQDSFRVDPQAAPPQYPPQYPPQQPDYRSAPSTPPDGYPTQPPAQPPTQPTPQYGYPTYPQQQQPPTQPMPQYGYSPQQAPMMAQPAPLVAVKRRSRAPLVIGIIVLLLAAIGIGGYFVYSNVLNPPAVSAEKLLPANTLGYFSFNPTLQGSQKAAMDKIGDAFTSQPGFKDALANITKTFTGMMGSDSGSLATPSATDLNTISSYLGNSITVALLPPSTDDLTKLQNAVNSGDIASVAPDVLGRNVVGIVDLDFNPLDKKGPITDLKQQADNIGKAQLVEKYRDVDIHKFITNTTEIYFALLGGTSTAVVSTQAAPLHVIIDQFKDNKSLKDDTTFKALSGQVPSDRIAALYLNLTEFYQQANLIAPNMLSSNSLQSANGAMLITVSAANDGMQVDVASEADLSVMNSGVQINSNARPDPSTLNDIPANSFGFLVGTDLKTSIQAVLDTMRKDPNTGPNVDKSLSDFKQQYGVDLEKDVLPLLDGDYSLSVSGSGQSGATPDVSVIFQLKVKDGAAAASLLDKIASSDTLKSSTQKVSVAGGTFYTSSDQSQGALAGVTQNRFIVVFNSTTLDAAQATLQDTVNNFGKGLGSTGDWSTVKTHLPDGSNVIGYLNFTSLRGFAESSMSDTDKQDYSTNVKPLLSPFKYLLLGSATQATKDGNLSRNHTVLFIGISK